MMPGTEYPLPLSLICIHYIFILHMARYVITDTQSKDVIHKYLDNNIIKPEEKENPHEKGSYSTKMLDKNNDTMFLYIWYVKGGEYDDDDSTVHNGIGHVQVHPKIVDLFRQMFKMRESKILDIISEWVDKNVKDEVDTVTIWPQRAKPPVY
jgi:hypothetical protein